jgi:hypothetical protein
MAPAQNENERAGMPAEYSARKRLRAISMRAAHRRARRAIQPVSQRHALRQRLTGRRDVDIIELAREAGLQVLLDARIGTLTYHSVSGSLTALQRFADAVEAEMRERVPRPRDPPARQHAKAPRHTPATRLRKRAMHCRERHEREALRRVESARPRSF